MNRDPREIRWEQEREEVERRQLEGELYEAECGHLHRPPEDPHDHQMEQEWREWANHSPRTAADYGAPCGNL